MMSQTVAALVSKMTTRIEAEFIKPSATRDDGKPEPLILTECIRALATDCIFKTIVDNPEWESLLDMVVFQAGESWRGYGNEVDPEADEMRSTGGGR